MRNHLYFLGFVLLYFGSSCETECSYNQAQLKVNNATNGEELLSITAPVCPEGSATIVENESYYILSVLAESALADGEDPWASFEEGKQITFPMIGIHEESRHIIEVRHRSSLWNNLDQPYLSNWDNVSEGDVNSYKTEIQLTGHPLYLMLSLLNVDDKGGAKTWAIFNFETLDGAPLQDMTGWECFMDNRYSFMKGNRYKYDPNGPGNDGPLCLKDSLRFSRYQNITKDFGTYQVLQNRGGLQLRMKSNVSSDNFLESEYEVISYDWDELRLLLSNDNNEQAVAVLTPYQYDETL